MSLISFIVRCDQAWKPLAAAFPCFFTCLASGREAPFEMQAAAGQCLVQLTTADSVFLSKTDAGTVLETEMPTVCVCETPLSLQAVRTGRTSKLPSSPTCLIALAS